VFRLEKNLMIGCLDSCGQCNGPPILEREEKLFSIICISCGNESKSSKESWRAGIFWNLEQRKTRLKNVK